MRALALTITLLTSACVHPPQPENPSGESLAKTAAETTRRQLEGQSPVLYSTSKPQPETSETPAETTPPTADTPPEPEPQPEPGPVEAP